MTPVADLLRQFELERLEVNLFRGESRDIGSPQVFGGQVLGQALMAAYSTIESELRVHSLHAYFLRRGDFNLPIVYQVDRSRDGHSFSSRRVVAIQNGAPIFTFSSSYQRPEAGLEHQSTMPDVPPPETLPDWSRPSAEVAERLPEKLRRFLIRERPVELRPVEPIDFLKPQPGPPVQNVWFRTAAPLPDNPRLHECLLAYLSDLNLLNVATRPHASGYHSDDMVMASIDHAMWFHRTVKADEWMLYALDSPSASGARGFCRGSIYNREGLLLASTAQEGLIRVISKLSKNERAAKE
ncbi:MAG: acyl-CoA thioesterase II [Gammaproteobacteria bacterium]|nr:acyl-CoA thioesterase II [Gammaproteobacteria bacterium]